MDITGIDHAKILAALYNGSKQQGMGCFDPNGKDEMTVEQAQIELQRRDINTGTGIYFDYLHGRVMKIRFTSDDTKFDTWLYNRDNGEGAAERLISKL